MSARCMSGSAIGDYWDSGKPLIDFLKVHDIRGERMRGEALKSGGIVRYEVSDLSKAQSLQADGNIELKDPTTSGTRQFVMDNREGSVFHDKNLRKAIQAAYDRDFVRGAAYYGMGARANDHPVGPTEIYYWDERPIVERDLNKAKQYLAAAGYQGSIDLTLHTMNDFRLLEAALAFKDSLAEAHIRVEVVQEPSETYWEEVWLSRLCRLLGWKAGNRRP